MTENAMQDPNYYRNGYPADWTTGYQTAQATPPGTPVTVPDGVFHDAFVNGMQQAFNDMAMQQQQQQAQQFVPPVQQVAAPQPVQPMQFTAPPVAQQPAQAFQQAFAAPQQQVLQGVAQPFAPNVTPPAQTAGQATSMLDQMAQEIAGPSAAQQAAQPPAVTSAGGFALLDGIEDELDQGNGEAFKFTEVGDQIVGYVRYVTQVRSDYGDKDMVPMLDIEDKDGKLWTVRAYGAAMKNQIEKNDPHVGDGIAIRFTGMVTPRSGNGVPYKDVNVRVRRAN